MPCSPDDDDDHDGVGQAYQLGTMMVLFIFSSGAFLLTSVVVDGLLMMSAKLAFLIDWYRASFLSLIFSGVCLKISEKVVVGFFFDFSTAPVFVPDLSEVSKNRESGLRGGGG